MKSTRRKLLRTAGIAGGAFASGTLTKASSAPDPAGLLAVFAKRQTIRRYKSDPVPGEHLKQILDAARRGPTCMNQQPWTFLVVRDQKKIQELRKRTLARTEKSFEEAAGQDPEKKNKVLSFMEGYFTAPVYVSILVDKRLPGSGYSVLHDGPIAAAYLMVAARAFGYGTGYLTDGIPNSIVREVLGIPEHYHSVCITPIGVPDSWPAQAPKRKLEEMIATETLDGYAPLKPLPYHPI